MEIVLHSLAREISACWTRAEKSVAELIARKYPDPAEENITFLLAGELREAVARASQEGRFAQALKEDLLLVHPQPIGEVAACSEGLIARVDFHKRHHEGGRSGADLGLIITQPSLIEVGPQAMKFQSSPSRALLAQAKLNNRPAQMKHGRWRHLTRPQTELLPQHREYYSLLLYCLEGDDRTKLLPFRWQLCAGQSVGEVGSWLRSGKFPAACSSKVVIEDLSLGRIGTDSRSVIEKVIAPSSPRCDVIEIHLFWPDDPHPPGTVIEMGLDAEQRQVVEIRQYR